MNDIFWWPAGCASVACHASEHGIRLLSEPKRGFMRSLSLNLCTFVIASLSLVPSARYWAQRNGLAGSLMVQQEVPNVKIGLAKSEDSQQLQQFVCELYGADKQKMESMALVDLPNIGGWYAIQIYRELLSPEARVRYYRAKAKSGRISSHSSEPRIWSLTQLPKIVPNPPFGLPEPNIGNQELLRQIQSWKDWIQANETSLSKLQPTGDGIDFSGTSCGDAHSIPVRRGQGSGK